MGLRVDALSTNGAEDSEIEATGHSASAPARENDNKATCADAGSYNLVTRCSKCAEVLSSEHVEVPALGHSWGEWEIIEGVDGAQQRICSRCGETELKNAATESDPAIKDPDPATTEPDSAATESDPSAANSGATTPGADPSATKADPAAAGSGSTASGSDSALPGSGLATAPSQSISSAEIYVDALTYKGKPLVPSVTVMLSGAKLEASADYMLEYRNAEGVAIPASAIVAAGSYTVVVTGKNLYSGSLMTTFKVKKAKISLASFSKVKKRKLVNRGKAVKPKLVIRFAGKKLKAGVDYKLSYKGNKKVGTAKVIVKGKGNFKGTKKIKYRIIAE